MNTISIMRRRTVTAITAGMVAIGVVLLATVLVTAGDDPEGASPLKGPTPGTATPTGVVPAQSQLVALDEAVAHLGNPAGLQAAIDALATGNTDGLMALLYREPDDSGMAMVKMNYARMPLTNARSQIEAILNGNSATPTLFGRTGNETIFPDGTIYVGFRMRDGRQPFADFPIVLAFSIVVTPGAEYPIQTMAFYDNSPLTEFRLGYQGSARDIIAIDPALATQEIKAEADSLRRLREASATAEAERTKTPQP